VPALVFTIVVTQIPFLLTLWYSFQKYNLNYPHRPRQFPTLLMLQVADDHIRAFARQQLRVRSTHALGATRDQHHLARNTPCHQEGSFLCSMLVPASMMP